MLGETFNQTNCRDNKTEWQLSDKKENVSFSATILSIDHLDLVVVIMLILGRNLHRILSC